jgi:hypothetical protein
VTRNDDDAAFVKTLTAEVRVVMMGSRQVTANVYSQLDVVEPKEIEPFGRVTMHHAGVETATGKVEVIGRHRVTGALVRSQQSYFSKGGKEWDNLPKTVFGR